jgi:preprotein translocase subunit SecF
MKIRFIDDLKIYMSISLLLIIISIGAVFVKGFNYGIDFSGGNLFQITYDNGITLSGVNEKLDTISNEIPQLSANSRKVQISDDKVVILRSQEITEAEKEKVLETLKSLGTYKIDKVEKVGASIGEELKYSAIYSLGIGAILIVIYITIRFEFVFAISAVIALIHDIIIAMGAVVLLGFEINTPFIAAVLTILGYSINDTIVIYDRVRENLAARRRTKLSIQAILENSIGQVISRSVNTSLTTLFSIVALLIFGGDSLKTFIVTLLIGVLIGTYSSLFIATPLVYLLSKNKKTLEEFDAEKKEDEEDKILV